MATKVPPPNSAFLAPRYWPTWLGIGFLCLAAWLPFRLRIGLGTLIGLAAWRLARERRYITEVNMDLCFPELDSKARSQLVRQTFIENGIGLIETGCGWVRPPQHFRSISEFRGDELIARALTEGRGVLILGAHYSTLDFCANLMSLYFPFAVTYRAHKNPLFDAFMLRGRIRNCNGVFDRKDIRGAFRHLKSGKILWYAPDQDYGPDQSVFAPWFGQAAATITAGSRFADFNKSPVLIVSHRRVTSEARYILEALAPEQPLPSGDDLQDAMIVNRMLEQEIRKAPAQYLWMHKRFKTRPGGKPESPYIFITTPVRKLDAEQYRQLVEDSVEVSRQPDRLLLPRRGMQLWQFPGIPRKGARHKHPVWRMDQITKWLRSRGIPTLTLDCIFLVPHLEACCPTLFVPEGQIPGSEDAVPPETAAAFLYAVHTCGCHFIRSPLPDMLRWNGNKLALTDPLALKRMPGTTACADRLPDLDAFASCFSYTASHRSAFLEAYVALCRPAEARILREGLH